MPDVFTSLQEVPLSSYKHSSRLKRQLLSASIGQSLDRVNVLGDEHTGHTGCVNALSWAKDGEVLLSGGDDTTVRVWRIDPSNTTQEYPFVCDVVIQTGHRGNVFNNQFLPHSTRIASVARDGQVRISDVGDVMEQSVSGREVVYTPRQTKVRVLRCHDDSVKRIITEDSPDVFLTVSEDGSVRQHDLRTHHVCSEGQCPAPLVQMKHSLSTMSLSPLTPYQFVVAGESPYGYLFDRRHSMRHLRYEWGMSPEKDSVTTCVRRFGRENSQSHERSLEHITGCRMAGGNGHEVLLSYSSDGVYLYSTHDDTRTKSKETAMLRPNKKRRLPSPSKEPTTSSSSAPGSSISNTLMEEDIERFVDEDDGDSDEDADMDSEDCSRNEEDDEEEDDDSVDEHGTTRDFKFYPDVPVVMPRSRFAGHCNVETVKDVNFLGPEDEFVVSGSDDGHWFMWNKSTGRLHDILEGDGSVVNVIEQHPHFPLVAVSGIDTTVKLFAPAHGPRSFSRLDNADNIIQRNSEAASSRTGLTRLVVYTELARRMGLDSDQCANQ